MNCPEKATGARLPILDYNFMEFRVVNPNLPPWQAGAWRLVTKLAAALSGSGRCEIDVVPESRAGGGGEINVHCRARTDPSLARAEVSIIDCQGTDGRARLQVRIGAWCAVK